MKRAFSQLAAMMVVAVPAPVLAQSQAQGGVDTPNEIVCQLLDNCGGTPDAATEPASPRGAPRTSKTRGFSLVKPNESDAAPAARSPAGASRPARTVARAPQKRRTGGQYDLRVSFVSGSAELTAPARDRTAVFAAALRDPRLADRRVRIEGHTDGVGDADSNQALSERRAQAVADALGAAGIDSGRLDVRGLGESQPLPGTRPNDGANRRVIAALIK